MNITMEKKKAAPKGMKLPSKTYINLAQNEISKKDVIATVLGLILILIVAGCVAKFGVIDQLERLDRVYALVLDCATAAFETGVRLGLALTAPDRP